MSEVKSHHIFLFPFRWKLADSKRSFSEKTHPETFKNRLPAEDWERRTWNYSSIEDYNEYTYFYDFVREVLYDQEEEIEQAGDIIRHFSYKPLAGEQVGKYLIKANGKLYELILTDIHLNVYGTGAGVISFHLENHKAVQSDPDSILAINQFGRRVFAPFLGGAGQASSAPPLLANELKVVFPNGKEPLIENFSGLNDWEGIRPGITHLSRTITGLFPETHFVFDEQPGKEDKIQILPALDDRMFVVCTYQGSEDLITNMKPPALGKQKEAEPTEAFATPGYLAPGEAGDFWSRFVLIDSPGGGSFGNLVDRQEAMKKHTYTRWADDGTFYGISRYSLVCLLGPGALGYLKVHMRTMYYKMAELSLVQRASLIRFSDEVTHLSHLGEEVGPTRLTKDIRELYRAYIRFINKIYFREVTPQEQGIDMYDKMQESMRLEHQIKELDQEIEELHSYASMLAEKQRNQKLDWLAVLGGLFLVPTFLIAYFDMGVFEHSDFLVGKAYRPWLIAFVAVLLGGATAWTTYRWNKKGREGRISLLFTLILLVIALLIPLVSTSDPSTPKTKSATEQRMDNPQPIIRQGQQKPSK
jgi:preprotein translocase subunit Sec61beta